MLSIISDGFLSPRPGMLKSDCARSSSVKVKADSRKAFSVSYLLVTGGDDNIERALFAVSVSSDATI